MAASWGKASYGGTTGKSGGGKLNSPNQKGDRGLHGVGGIANSTFERKKGIVTPTTEGNKGVVKGGAKSAPPPKD